MRSTSRLIAAATLSLSIIGCGPSITVRTMAAPEAGFDGLHTFSILPTPARSGVRPATAADDPMINNSIANRAIRDRIIKTFEDRGYVLTDENPELAVAFYASAQEKLDLNVWNYGYPANPEWGLYPASVQIATPSTEGSVVVDVVNLTTRQLWWRGEGRASLSGDANKNMSLLVKAADAVCSKFPAALFRGRGLADRPE